MFRIIKTNDITLGHFGGCTPCPGVMTMANLTVFSENVLISTEGDVFNPHPDTATCHPQGAVYTVMPLTCSPNVFANGKKVTVENSLLACGDLIGLNADNLIKTKVFVNSIF